MAQDHIYLLDQGQLMAATSHNVQDNRPVEVQDHVKRFYEFFFTLDLGLKAIEHNVT